MGDSWLDMWKTGKVLHSVKANVCCWMDSQHFGHGCALGLCSYHGAQRIVVVCSPHVDFCGFSAPHPSEDLINLRIQTTGKQQFYVNY